MEGGKAPSMQEFYSNVQAISVLKECGQDILVKKIEE
jgi:hypothetical protein